MLTVWADNRQADRPRLSWSLINANRTDPIVPILVRVWAQAPIAQVRDALARGGVRAAEVCVVVKGYGYVSVDSHRGDLVIEAGRNIQAGALFLAEIISGKMCLAEETRTVARLVRGGMVPT